MEEESSLRQQNLELTRRLALLEADEPVSATDIKRELRETAYALDLATAQKKEALSLVFSLVNKEALRSRIKQL